MKKQKQALSKFLPREPRNIDAEDWFYIQPNGICFVHQVYSHHQLIQTDQITIPWRMLREAINDFDRAEQKQTLSRKTKKKSK